MTDNQNDQGPQAPVGPEQDRANEAKLTVPKKKTAKKKSAAAKLLAPEPGFVPERGPMLAAAITELPQPFRPRHLTELMAVAAREDKLSPEQTASMDPFRFLKDHGLPNPMRRFRVKGTLRKVELPVEEIEAVDESDATAQYKAIHAADAPHHCRCKLFLIDY